MDAYEARGTLYKLFDAEQVTERFRKRELVLEISPCRYPQYVSFQLTGERCELADGCVLGEELSVRFRLRGREWTSRNGDVRYFNSLDVTELERLSQATPEPAPAWLDGDAPPPGDDDAPAFDEDVPF